MNKILHYYTKGFRLLCKQKHRNPVPALGGESFKNNTKYDKCKNCLKILEKSGNKL